MNTPSVGRTPSRVRSSHEALARAVVHAVPHAMEALARWTHPERGAVSPASVVAVAELTGLAAELDRWVVQRALCDAGQAHACGAVSPATYVAINLSARDLGDSHLDRDLPVWTTHAGVTPEQVVLEITESAIIQDTELAIGPLRRLREQGFRVAVDDSAPATAPCATCGTCPSRP